VIAFARVRLSRTAVLSGVIFLAAVALAGLLGGRDVRPGTVAAARARVQVTSLRREVLPGEVSAGGFLRAREDVTVAAERAGRVVDLPVAEGERVACGAPIAHLEDTVAQANVERARVVAREAALEPRTSAADLAAAAEQLRLAEHELSLRHPVSPIAGIVEKHYVDVGEYVQSGAPLVDVLDLSGLILDVDVDPETLAFLEPGERVPVDVSALDGGRRFEGEIRRVATRAGMRTRRFRVEIMLPGDGEGLRAGMHAEARFALAGGAPGIYLPKEAVRTDRAQSGIFVVENDVVRWHPVHVKDVHYRPDLVRVDESTDQHPPAEGTLVVVSGFSGLRDGTRVEVAR